MITEKSYEKASVCCQALILCVILNGELEMLCTQCKKAVKKITKIQHKGA